MDEIVRKLRDKRHKPLFESAEIPEEEIDDEEELTDAVDSIHYYLLSGTVNTTGKFKGYIFPMSNYKSVVKKLGKNYFRGNPSLSKIHKSNIPSMLNDHPEGRYTLLENETEEEGQIAEEGEFEEFQESANNISLGFKFKLEGFEFEVIAIKGEWSLAYARTKKTYPYFVLLNLNNDGSCERYHRYESKERAHDLLMRKPGTLKESEDTVAKKKCTCGSTDVVTEEGKDVCNECGRILPEESVDEATDVDKKPAALRKALEWWRAGHYQKAVQLYKKYGVTDREFARALLGINESEEGIDFDDNQLEESLELSVATPYVERDGEESVRVVINGDEYRYRSETLPVSELVKKFSGIYKHSTGSALQWLKKNSYVYYNGRTKKFAENKDIVYKDKLKEGEESPLDKNIIRAVHTPMTTADKPGFDASISEATGVEKQYTERELIAYLRGSKDSTIYIRTSFVRAGWDDVQFAASRAGYRVSRIYDKNLLKKLSLSGDFAEFYVFTKI